MTTLFFTARSRSGREAIIQIPIEPGEQWEINNGYLIIKDASGNAVNIFGNVQPGSVQERGACK